MMFMDETLERLVAGPLVWISALHAATKIVAGREQRLRGIDPSTLEPSDQAAHYLAEAVPELEDLAYRMAGLQADVLSADDGVARIAATFDYLIMLSRTTDVVGDVHRRLLSLYPEVPADLVEDARHLHADLQRMADDEAAAHGATTRVYSFVSRLREALSSGGN